jgi:hypothetical protein
MPLLVRNLRLSLDDPDDVILPRAARRLRVPVDAIRAFAVVRRAIDARRGADLARMINVELALHGGAKAEQAAIRRRNRPDVDWLRPNVRPAARTGTTPIRHRPIVVGFGPAGMFAGLFLARRGYAPIVLDRGRDVRTRHRDVMQRYYRNRDFDPESNLLFGEGGAGAYSDGKLYTRVNNPLCDEVLADFYRYGARPDILTDGRPHVGSDKLPGVCRRMRMAIEALDGEVRFGALLNDIEIADGRVTAARINDERVPCDALLLGVGHSARDTVAMLVRRGVTVDAKPFQFGVRVEHPQALVDTWQYGAACGHAALPPAEYHLKAPGAAGPGADVFSFCMCPGGAILPTNERPGLIATNGASRAARGGPFANSGLVMTINPDAFGDDPLAGLAFIESFERRAFELTGGTYAVPAQRAADFIANRASDGAIETSFPLGAKWTSVADVLPDAVPAAIARAMQFLNNRYPGFAGNETLVTGPESRASAPIRVTRDHDTRQSVSVAGLYPMGEGAGYAGGIVSAAVDGIRTAETVMAQFAP